MTKYKLDLKGCKALVHYHFDATHCDFFILDEEVQQRFNDFVEKILEEIKQREIHLLELAKEAESDGKDSCCFSFSFGELRMLELAITKHATGKKEGE